MMVIKNNGKIPGVQEGGCAPYRWLHPSNRTIFFCPTHFFLLIFTRGGGRGKGASTNSYFLKKIWVIPIVSILFSSITLPITIFITMLRQIHSVIIFDGIKKKKLWIYCRWRYKIVIGKVVLLKKIETIGIT